MVLRVGPPFVVVLACVVVVVLASVVAVAFAAVFAAAAFGVVFSVVGLVDD